MDCVSNGSTKLNAKFHADVSEFPLQMSKIARMKAVENVDT